MNKIIKRALIDAIGTYVYVIIVVLFIFSLQIFQGSKENILIPIAMLSLFVCSAAITGFLVFGQPIMLYIDGKKKDAIYLLVHTLGLLVLLTLISFIIMIAVISL